MKRGKRKDEEREENLRFGKRETGEGKEEGEKEEKKDENRHLVFPRSQSIIL